MGKFSFRFYAISIFAILSFMVVSVLLYINANFNKNLTKEISNAQFDMLSSDFNLDLENLESYRITHLNNISSFLKHQKQDDEKLVSKDNMKFFADFLNLHKYYYAISIGLKDNRFFNMRKANKNEKLAGYNVTDKDKWLTRKIANGIETRTYYDENLDVTFSRRLIAYYNVSERPWFTIANQNKVTRTKTYTFYLFPTDGFTYSKEFKKGYVVALDVLSTKYSQLLNDRAVLKKQNACFVDNDFNIIAKTKSLDIDVAKKIFAQHKKGIDRGNVNVNGKKYIYKISPSNDEYLVTFSDFDTLIQPFRDEFKRNVIIASIVVAILCLSIWFLASLVIKPIRMLALENEKIVSGNIDHIKRVKSNIKEVNELSNSLVAMANYTNSYQKELERLSETDALTKIFNRSKLDETLRFCIDDFKRYGHKFGFMMVDIDFFKTVNDEHGHQVGDEILQEFVGILKAGIRQNDTLGRWGGEEFAIICKEIDMENLEKLAQKLRLEIEGHIFKIINHKTASFGISICLENDNAESIVHRADDALYRAKENGRNRVEKG